MQGRALDGHSRPPRHVQGANTGQSPDGYPIALFLSRVVIFGRGQGSGAGAGVDCCYSGTIKGAPAEPRGCKGGQLLAMGQARSPVPALV